MIEAIFFDLYETLVTEFDPDWRPRPTAAERLGIDQRVFDAEWRTRQPERLTGAYPDFPSVLRDVCRVVAQPADEAVIRQLRDERLGHKAKPFARLDPAVLDSVRAIGGMAVKLGVIGNCGGPEEVAGWDGSELAEHFQDVVLSFEVGCAKPNSEIYHLACERLGVAPERSIFVGDGGFDELAGAAKVGMIPYWASWFIDRWPDWRRSQPVYDKARTYPRLKTPEELVAIVEEQRIQTAE